MKTFNSLGDFWRHYVPTYKARSFRPFLVRFPYSGISGIAKRIRNISERRSANRIANYVDPGELSRVRNRLGYTPRRVQPGNGRTRASLSGRLGETKTPEKVRVRNDVSIRFGVAKPGHGYGKERGDFCLVAAVYSGRTLTLFYRSIELIGGFAFDLVLIDHVCKELGIEPKWIEIWSPKAFVFALKGNSNEKLYPKLKTILRVRNVRKED